ncbi:sigma-70 region 4 domain-containing protein [Candidatus Woesearchaeota archaeon]|nr:sigma-70 region 4 domain-containing protein [Candidatus Woesearchaeota archaeon]
MKRALPAKEVFLKELISDSDLAGLQNRIELILKKHGLEKEVKIVVEDENAGFLPNSIFTKKLGIAESVVKYLRENLELPNMVVGELLHKTANNVAVIYRKATQKQAARFEKLDFEHKVPFEAFSDSRYTTFEAIALFYSQQEMSLKQIAAILHRDERTIWTTLQRARSKHD